jgi:hypothetical protein
VAVAIDDQAHAALSSSFVAVAAARCNCTVPRVMTGSNKEDAKGLWEQFEGAARKIREDFMAGLKHR